MNTTIEQATSAPSTPATQIHPPDPQALRQTVAGVLMEFVRAVEPRDFCAFTFLVAYGSPTQAAHALGIARGTLFRWVGSWATRGPAYQRMLKLVPCRHVGVPARPVALGTTAESGEASPVVENPETLGDLLDQIEARADAQRDYPALLRDLREALRVMNAKNWEAVRGSC